jgi:hypothetical protein
MLLTKATVVGLTLLVALTALTLGRGGDGRGFRAGRPTAIPRTWDDEALAAIEVPIAALGISPTHMSSELYYRERERQIYKSYPVYYPGKEPPGYMEWLKQQEPEIAFDASKLKTEEDWIKAGEQVFDAPIFYDIAATVSDVRDPAWYQKIGVPVTKDGVMPFMRYVVTKKGEVQLGGLSCSMCHTRVMPDGSVIKGAQGNFPADRQLAHTWRARFKVERARLIQRLFYGVPWLRPDPQAQLENMSIEEITAFHDAIPPGVLAREGLSPTYPVQVPDLIGIKDRRYFDHTGLVRQRSPADLMRYAALVQGAYQYDRYGDFQLARRLPDPATQERYSDEQLFALAKYIYSLKPPANPNKVNSLAARGRKIFNEQGCAQCHTPPLYTNNKLTPVEGFNVPEEHYKQFDIMPTSVGTNPDVALKTRKGTGYYKVPSLRGVWYRGPLEHSGSVLTLEDWFDPRRLRDDYVPTGYRGLGVKARAVRGHQFGLELSEKDRKALIAFLRTL